MDDKIVANLRVISCHIKPLLFNGLEGESLEVKANGNWISNKINPAYVCENISYSVSVHFTAYPGCGVIPALGDNIKVTIERA